MHTSVFFEGLGLGASLIVAIGAQNAFVLRQGLRRERVATCVLICSACDIGLIALGVSGLGGLLAAHSGWSSAIKWIGAAFLAAYGLRSAQSALRPPRRDAAAAVGIAAPVSVAASAFAFSLLNPHVYLDTVLLLGSIGARHAGEARVSFAAGAMLASLSWFFFLGFGARYAAPLFIKPAAWRVLDCGIAVVMGTIAISLIR